MSKNTILLGYMGCGKSSIGKAIEEIYSKKYFDLDSVIEKEQQLSINEIFEQKGALFFRKLERKTLENIINSNKNAIISLGGGTPCYYDTMNYLEVNYQKTIYLKSSVKILTQRLYLEKDNRPLLSEIETEKQLEEFIAKHLFERTYFYQKAQHTVLVDKKEIEEISKEIIDLIKND